MGDSALSARSLGFGYEQGHLLFADLDLDLTRGQVVAVTGPSGRGKSSLMYVLGLMLRPSAGTVEIDGTDVASLPDRGRAALRASRFGFVFQDAALDHTRSVLENVMEASLYRAPADPQALETHACALLEQFGVSLRASARPGQVSGGQAQRIALCRALLHDPQVILADEPTGNLDPGSSNIVLDALIERSHRHGAAVLIVTHDPQVTARSDRVFEL